MIRLIIAAITMLFVSCEYKNSTPLVCEIRCDSIVEINEGKLKAFYQFFEERPEGLFIKIKNSDTTYGRIEYFNEYKKTTIKKGRNNYRVEISYFNNKKYNLSEEINYTLKPNEVIMKGTYVIPSIKNDSLYLKLECNLPVDTVLFVSSKEKRFKKEGNMYVLPEWSTQSNEAFELVLLAMSRKDTSQYFTLANIYINDLRVKNDMLALRPI